eukprot:TRINITY_DN33242_c0_g1_i1.p1 TRINITY_DN33242_c0_g1~~TRINITY_DN33242_c0_g1_i1.p1  ORF type:complete len:512 (+),score=93.27 TRINITY_DN33242_c0_g1_i1:81-1616(+)
MGRFCGRMLSCCPAAVALAAADITADKAHCNNPLVGTVEGPVMPDSAISASSQLSDDHSPRRIRLDWTGWAWAAAEKQNQWLQFDFAGAVKLTQVRTKGQFLADEWVTQFQLQYSAAANNWVLLNQVFRGNSDRDTLQVNDIRPPILATKLKIRPKGFHGRIAMRVELIGCQVKVEDELTCRSMRCEDGSAVGEGVQCCADGVCSSKSTHSGLVWSQLYCAQRRYDELAAQAVKGAWPLSEEVARHAEEVRQQKETFARDGFVALRGALSLDLVDTIQRNFEDVVWDVERHRRPGCFLEFSSSGSFRINRTVSLRSAPYIVRKQPYRMVGIHLGAEEPKAGPWNRVFWNARLISTIQRLLGGPARLFQALVFERGSQQAMHDDTWYLPGSDHRGGMVGVWVALDGTDEGNGPLFYYPGSHVRQEWILNPDGRTRKHQISLPNGVSAPADLQEAVAENAVLEVSSVGWRREVFEAAPGDAAIWHERLLHGGSTIANMSRTRLSLVMHYVLDA